MQQPTNDELARRVLALELKVEALIRLGGEQVAFNNAAVEQGPDIAALLREIVGGKGAA
jgi:hypothetical protein